MKRFLQKVKIIKKRYSSNRAIRKTLEANEAKLLVSARLMACEYPIGTSPHYIVYQLKRSKAREDSRRTSC